MLGGNLGVGERKGGGALQQPGFGKEGVPHRRVIATGCLFNGKEQDYIRTLGRQSSIPSYPPPPPPTFSPYPGSKACPPLSCPKKSLGSSKVQAAEG